MFEVSLAFSEDVLGLIHSKLEVFPLIVNVSQVSLVLLSQFKRASGNVTVVVVHDELKLLLNRVNLALQLGFAAVDLSPLV